MKTPLPKSGFVNDLIRCNQLHLCDFDCFLFFQGMLFNSDRKWWGQKGGRRSLHEGIDVCFFESRRGQYFRLDESTDVPMIYDGRVEHITDDFLGKTVIARHFSDLEGIPGADQPACLSLYGHLNPDKNLRVGDELKHGQVFAKIAGVGKKKQLLPPHLHLSLANPHLLPPAHKLEWEFLNTVDRKIFFDPIDILIPRFKMIEYRETMDLYQQFVPCNTRYFET